MNRKIYPDNNNETPAPRSYNDTDTYKKGMNTISLSPTNRDANTNISVSNIELFQQYCQQFHDQVIQITNTRLVENLGSIMTKQEKQEELKKFDILWKNFLSTLQKITDITHSIDFTNENLKTNEGMPVLDQFPREIKLIESTFYDLVQQSSLRFLHKCTDIYDLDEYDIDLEFNIRGWYTNNRDYINKFNKRIRQNQPEQKKSFCASICPCIGGGSGQSQDKRRNSNIKNSERSLKKKQLQQ